MSIDVGQARLISGVIAAYITIPGQWVGNILVCTRCTCTTFFTVNGPTMLERVPEASLVHAQIP